MAINYTYTKKEDSASMWTETSSGGVTIGKEVSTTPTTWTLVFKIADVSTNRADGLFTIAPTLTAKYASLGGRKYASMDVEAYFSGAGNVGFHRNLAGWAGNTNITIKGTPTQIDGHNIFVNASKTARYVDVPFYLGYIQARTSSIWSSSNPVKGAVWGYLGASPNLKIGTVRFTLNTPPEGSVSVTFWDKTNHTCILTYHANDRFNANITSVAPSIGTNTISSKSYSTYSIEDQATIPITHHGNFKPTIVITNSRGVTATKTASAVNIFQPRARFSCERIKDSEGQGTELGGIITATFEWFNNALSLVEPEITVKNSAGEDKTCNITWFTDNALTIPVTTWDEGNGSRTVYGVIANYQLTADTPQDVAQNPDKKYYNLIDGNYIQVALEDGDDPSALGYYEMTDSFDQDTSYEITIIPKDNITSEPGLAAKHILPGIFYTIDFLAGGHGIAFGQPCTQAGFWNRLPSTFESEGSINDPVIKVLGSSTGIITVQNDQLNTSTGIAVHKDNPGATDYSSVETRLAVGTGSTGQSSINHGVYTVMKDANGGIHQDRWMIYSDGNRTIIPQWYPVNSVVVTYTNTNPGSWLPGTWSLFDKEFRYQWITTGFTFNTTNTYDGVFLAIPSGHTIEFRFAWKNKTVVSDSEIIVGTLNRAAVGVQNDGHGIYGIAGNDGMNAIGIMLLDMSSTSAVLKSYDWVTRATSYPSDTGGMAMLTIVYTTQGVNTMIDSFCNKFYWRRTA